MTDLFRTHAERMAADQLIRDQQKRIDLAEQCSPANPATLRIRVWERLHGLRLPPDPLHPILQIVASGTGLTLAQVREEQLVRLPAVSLPALSVP
jgi:hypothetical protein